MHALVGAERRPPVQNLLSQLGAILAAGRGETEPELLSVTRHDLSHRLELCRSEPKLSRFGRASGGPEWLALRLDDDVGVRPAAMVGMDGIDVAEATLAERLRQGGSDGAIEPVRIGSRMRWYREDEVCRLASLQPASIRHRGTLDCPGSPGSR
jgi:hypothetical protein